MIDPNLVTLETHEDGSVSMMYDGWYIVKLTKQGSLRRIESVGARDLKVGEDEKVRLVK